jgi:hypothetical protein
MISEREPNSIVNPNKYGSFEFAEFSFDLREKILLRGTEKISMPPKTCELQIGVFKQFPGKIF